MFSKKLFLPLLVPLALLAGACSDSDDSSASEEDSTTTAPSQEAATPEETDTADGTAAEVDAADAAAGIGDAMGTPPSGDTADLNITEIAAGTADVSTLTRLVIKGGLLPTLRDGGPFTVFAPTNQAFAAIPSDTLNAVSANQAQLADVLTLHVLPGEYTSEDLIELNGSTVKTVQGAELAVVVEGDTITVGGATVISPDVPASNGVIHVVDTVIVEPDA